MHAGSSNLLLLYVRIHMYLLSIHVQIWPVNPSFTINNNVQFLSSCISWEGTYISLQALFLLGSRGIFSSMVLHINNIIVSNFSVPFFMAKGKKITIIISYNNNNVIIITTTTTTTTTIIIIIIIIIIYCYRLLIAHMTLHCTVIL